VRNAKCADALTKCILFRYTVLLKVIAFIFKLLTNHFQPVIFHLPIVACWLQVAVGQVFPLFLSPVQLSCVSCYARPVCTASPNCMSVQHIPVGDTSDRNPVRVIVICISVKISRPCLVPTLPAIQWVPLFVPRGA
jgi:hypothetical protein